VGFSATTATLPLGTYPMKACFSKQWSTCEIIEIRDVGVETVYDIEVAGTENFIANGYVSHNTRWNQDDLTGRILTRATERANDGARQWRRVIYPALAVEDEANRKKDEALHPARYSEEMLKAMRAEMDPREWNALYQQNPTPDEGVFFKKEWINYYKPGAIPKSTLRHYVTADLAIGEKKTNDYTVVAVLGVSPDDIIYVMPDMVRERLDSFAIVEALLDQACQYDATAIIIEREKTSMAIMPLLEKRMRERGRYFAVFDPSPTKDKAARASPLQGRMRQARVLFPDVRLFREVVEPEFLAFPLGKHDDITDAIATGVSELPKLTGGHRTPATSTPTIADDEPTPKNKRAFFAWQKPKTHTRPTVLRGK
jgi:predicted phage terminase large subunit-like protein